ncbi:MAG: phosphoglucosamine mutase [Candidatus Neomarinimicrobiota bacterium]|nr:phosphoglucosamine mutase [Candidatus Neomarinimicrobiota bacterium]RKY48134.1 MAG: phosphoglucosamine mutase [Candidatus Neomarinimicrobiota bacterium]
MLIESISGVRGTIGDSLQPTHIVQYASALGTYLQSKGTVIIGRDSRPSGEAIVRIFSATLQWMGIDVINIGIVPTPTVQLLTEKKGADAGIAITASHNPFPWNGIKYIDHTGLFMNAEQVQKIMSLKNLSDKPFKKSGEFGSYREEGTALSDHIENILEIPYIQVEMIRQKKFRVVVDAVNGGGSLALPALLKELRCDVIEINCTPDGYFPHTPEPLPENLKDLMDAVVRHKAHLGMAVDPDADRLAIVDEGGRYLSEEYTLVMAVKTVLSKTTIKKPLVVTNLSTTLAVDKVTKHLGGRIIRTAIGEINVSATMKAEKAVIGGEGNGGVILPDSHLGRDSLVGAALILQLLTDEDKPLSDIFASLPQYRMSKKKVEIGKSDPDTIITTLKKRYAQKEIDTTDGLKILDRDRWVHLRKSNTEPILRVYSEAPTLEEAESLGEAMIGEIKREL